MRRFGLIAMTVMSSLLVFTAPAWSNEKGKVSELVKDAKVTIDQAIKTASERVQGTVVEAELEKKHGKTIWEVEIVGADNKVTEVHIDAATGDVIDTEEKKMEQKSEKKKGKEKSK